MAAAAVAVAVGSLVQQPRQLSLQPQSTYGIAVLVLFDAALNHLVEDCHPSAKELTPFD